MANQVMSVSNSRQGCVYDYELMYDRSAGIDDGIEITAPCVPSNFLFPTCFVR